MNALLAAGFFIAVTVILAFIPWHFRVAGGNLGGRSYALTLNWSRWFSVEMAKSNGETRGVIRLGCYRHPLAGRSNTEKNENSSIKQKKRTASRVDRGSPAKGQTLVNALNPDALKPLVAWFKAITGAMRIKAQARGIYGTGDPASTGVIFGILEALKSTGRRLDFEPDFMEPVLLLEGEAQGRIIPGQIAFLTVKYALTKPVRKLWQPILIEALSIRRKKAYV
jgi:hypothetical protein